MRPVLGCLMELNLLIHKFLEDKQNLNKLVKSRLTTHCSLKLKTRLVHQYPPADYSSFLRKLAVQFRISPHLCPQTLLNRQKYFSIKCVLNIIT